MHAESDDANYYSSVSYHTAPMSPGRAAAGGGGKGAKHLQQDDDDFGVAKDKAKAGMGKLSGMFSSSEPHLHVMLVHKEGASKASSPAKAGGGGGGGVASPARAASAAASAASAAAAQHDPSEVVKPEKGAGGVVGVPEADKLLGEAFVNIVDLATARAKSLDEWFPLSEVGR